MLMRSQRNKGTSKPLPAYVSRLSRTHRWVASLIIAGAAGGIFANCRASDIAGPAPFRQQPQVSKAMLAQEPNRRFENMTLEQNPCDPTGPMVQVEGTTRLSLHQSVSTTMQTHTYIVVRTIGEGTRLTDAALTDDDLWAANSEDFFEIQLSPIVGSANENTIETHDVFRGKGRNPNFVRHTIMHVTFNSNGEPTADQSKSTFKCQT